MRLVSRVLLILLFLSVFSPMAFAKSNLTVYEVEGLPILAINGEVVGNFDDEYEEYDIEGPQSAVIYKGRTLVQLKEVSEGLGFNLKWDAKTKKIELKKGNTTIKLTVGSKKAYLNGKAKNLDVPPMTLAGRTMVPLRFIGEAMNAKVSWSEKENLVQLNQKVVGDPAPVKVLVKQAYGGSHIPEPEESFEDFYWRMAEIFDANTYIAYDVAEWIYYWEESHYGSSQLLEAHVLYLDKHYAILNVKYMSIYDYTVAGGAILGVKYYAEEGWRIYYQQNYSL